MNLFEDNLSNLNLFDKHIPFEVFEDQKVVEDVTPSHREPTVVNLNNLNNPNRQKYIDRIRETINNRRNCVDK
jgi:hypothetical protein